VLKKLLVQQFFVPIIDIEYNCITVRLSYFYLFLVLHRKELQRYKTVLIKSLFLAFIKLHEPTFLNTI